MVRCKAGEILRSEAYFWYAAATKDQAESQPPLGVNAADGRLSPASRDMQE